MSTPEVPHYHPAPPTTEDLDYAELSVIDLSKAATQTGRNELANEMKDALFKHGFFYVINHGYTPERTTRMTDIADVPFSYTSEEEKEKYIAKIQEDGSYEGYKFRKFWLIDNGVKDEIDQYNINYDITRREHPTTIRPFLPEIEAFMKHTHLNVLHPILRMLAIILELPEETFVNMHSFGRPSKGETHAHFMKYHPRCEEDEVKSKNVWLKGHTDIGTVTIIYSQPVAALQIMSKEGTWKWVKHVENALIVNTGDSLEFLSGGFFKPTIHRVFRPPKDQRAYTRLGLYYFCTTDHDVKLAPLKESPVLQREGITCRFDDKNAPTMIQWRKARTSGYGMNDVSTMDRRKDGTDVEMVCNIPVKHYN